MSSIAESIHKSRKIAHSEPDAVCDFELDFLVLRGLVQETVNTISRYGINNDIAVDATASMNGFGSRFCVKMEGPARLLHEFLVDLDVVQSGSDDVCNFEIEFSVGSESFQETTNTVYKYGNRNDVVVDATAFEDSSDFRFCVKMEGPARLLHEFLVDLGVPVSQYRYKNTV